MTDVVKADHRRPWADWNLEGRQLAQSEWDGKTKKRADDSSAERKEDRLGEKLQPNLAAGRAQSLSDADLLDSRLNVGEHAVHDADAADDQGDACPEREHDR